MTSENSLQEETRRLWDNSPTPVRMAEPPTPGDVVVLERTVPFDVEWAVLARDASRPDQLLTVVADGLPMVGSADVEIAAATPAGPLVLRCRFGGWVDDSLFLPATRTAVLDSGDVARAREHWEKVRAGDSVGTVVTLEVDDEPDYVDWIRDTVEPAWNALSGAKMDEPRAPATHLLRSRRRTYGSRLLAIAAMLLLATGVGLLWRQQSELRDLRQSQERAETAHRREIQDLLREQTRLKAEYERRLEVAGSERQRLELDYQSRLADLSRRLEAALNRAIILNPVALSLDLPRGQEKRFKIPAHASHVVFFVALEDPHPGQSYRAELADRATGGILWSTDNLREDLRELRIGLPAYLLPPGDYLLKILAADGSSSTKYQLQVIE